MITQHYYHSPVGWLAITANEDSLCGLVRVSHPEDNTHPSPVLIACAQQLDEYFAGQRTVFDLPLAYKGTPFQHKAWEQLLRIPYGHTQSYAAQALAIGHPKAFRAVGSANGANPIAIIIPCHRVLSAHGGMGGYAYGLEMKQYLLQLEQDTLGRHK